MNALAEIVLAARADRPHDVAVADGRRSLTHAELVAAARAEAAGIRREASRRSPLVAVCLPLSAGCVVSLLAAILGDYSICFVDPATPADRRDDLLAALGSDVTVDAAGIVGAVAPAGAADLLTEPGYVARSSGSTGSGPKAVLAPWTAVAAFVPAGAAALGLDREATWAEISHPAYDMSMTNLLLALAGGGGIRLSGALGDQLRPLRFVDRVAATHVRLAPRFIELAAAERRPPGRMPLRVWGSGGDRLLRAHVERVFALGVPAVVNTYGTSETIGFASAARLTASATVPSVQGCAPIGPGRVGPWTTRLAESEGIPMLRISSPHLPAGYLFGGVADYPRWEGPDAVLTGDIGARAGDDLFCLGRQGRRVKRNGSFVELDEIDMVVGGARSVPSFTVATRSGDLLSMVEADAGQIAGLRRELAAALRPEVVPDEVVAVARLPRLANGKIDQPAASALAESLLAGREG